MGKLLFYALIAECNGDALNAASRHYNSRKRRYWFQVDVINVNASYVKTVLFILKIPIVSNYIVRIVMMKRAITIRFKHRQWPQTLLKMLKTMMIGRHGILNLDFNDFIFLVYVCCQQCRGRFQYIFIIFDVVCIFQLNRNWNLLSGFVQFFTVTMMLIIRSENRAVTIGSQIGEHGILNLDFNDFYTFVNDNNQYMEKGSYTIFYI